MNETENLGPQETPPMEDLASQVERKVVTVFPDYSIVDREEFDATQLTESNMARGKILKFYTEVGQTEQDPRIWFIYRTTGLHLNYYDAKPTNPKPVRNVSDSLYGKLEDNWDPEKFQLALDKAKIHMYGVDPADPAFRSLPVTWDNDRFVTMGEKLDESDFLINGKKSAERDRRRKQFKAMKNVWSLSEENPEKAKELAILRISAKDTYEDLDGAFHSSAEIVEAIESGIWGMSYVIREMNIIESEESLLGDIRPDGEGGFLPRLMYR